jgi:putative membrane protein
MKPLLVLLFFGGLCLAIALIAWLGLGAVTEVMATAGSRLLWLVPYYLLPILCIALSWRALFEAGRAPPFRHLYSGAWVGLSVNWLLPVAQIGGEFVRVRWLLQRGVPGLEAGSTVVIDKTIHALVQVIYTLAGLALLVVFTGRPDITILALAACLALGGGIFLVYRVQRAGLFEALASLARRLSHSPALADLVSEAPSLDAAILEGYGRRRQVAIAFCWRMCFRIAVAGEIWLVLQFMGHPVSLLEAIVLESLGQAARGLAFAVPAGIGVQESAFVILGAALGLGPEVSLAVSLAKRFRELAIGLPGLLALQLSEGRALAGFIGGGRGGARRKRDAGR